MMLVLVGPSFRFIGGWGMDVTDGWMAFALQTAWV
jgi:hypothetical protein